MAQASRANRDLNPQDSHAGQRLREGALLLLIAVAAFLLLSLLTYSSNDPGWSYIGPREQAHNAGGLVGAWITDVIFILFGLLGYFLPLMIGWSGWIILKERNPDNSVNVHLVALRWVGFFLILGSGCALTSMHLSHLVHFLPEGAGGILGDALMRLEATDADALREVDPLGPERLAGGQLAGGRGG